MLKAPNVWHRALFSRTLTLRAFRRPTLIWARPVVRAAIRAEGRSTGGAFRTNSLRRWRLQINTGLLMTVWTRQPEHLLR